jgi:ketosteroid isomerase-like protein
MSGNEKTSAIRPSHVEALKGYFELYDREGFDAAVGRAEGLFDPEVEFSPYLARELEGRTYRGLEEVNEFFSELQQALGRVRYENRTFKEVGEDAVLLLARLAGSGRGSAVPVEQEVAILFEFREGLILRITAYGSHAEGINAAEERLDAQA